VRVLYFGTYDRGHPRNLNAIAAMRTAGIDVTERSVEVHGSGLLGALSVASAETRLLWPRRHPFDVVIVGYPGHFDVPRARRLAGRRPLVFDAVLSLEDELVGVRSRFRPRSAAATVLRVVDTRALRLPDLVVCGTRTEARYLESLGGTRAEAVFLGADEELFGETWAPTYPFTAVHFADASADVVRAAQAESEAPIRIVVRDEVAPADLGIAVAHAGVVLGSFRESRAIPAAVFDALSTGTPVITADTEAARELLVDGESALLVPPDDPDALAEAVSRIAADAALQTRVAAAGNRVFGERASRRALGARWAELLAPLV
jgi:hypothetical protein